MLRDFNINLLAFKENKEVKTFVDILQNNLITPTINLSTRITAQSSTNIDNILMSSFDSKNLCWKPFSRFFWSLSLANHHISNEYEMKENVKQSILIQDWKKFDECKFKSDFRSIDWDKIMKTKKALTLLF